MNRHSSVPLWSISKSSPTLRGTSVWRNISSLPNLDPFFFLTFLTSLSLVPFRRLSTSVRSIHLALPHSSVWESLHLRYLSYTISPLTHMSTTATLTHTTGRLHHCPTKSATCCDSRSQSVTLPRASDTGVPAQTRYNCGTAAHLSSQRPHR